MDANGTHSHLLLRRDDWLAAVVPDAARPVVSAPDRDDGAFRFDAAAGGLTQQPRVSLFVAAPADRPPRLADRRGAACDHRGNLFWIGADRRSLHSARFPAQDAEAPRVVWSLDAPPPPAPPAGEFAPRDPAPAPSARELAGLAITCSRHLVVGTVAPDGLLVFDLLADGEPWVLRWPAGLACTPFDLAATPAGGILVLDRVHRIWLELDAHLQFLPRGAPLAGLARPLPEGEIVALEGLPDGRVVFLDSGRGATPPAGARLHVVGVPRDRDGGTKPAPGPVTLDLQAALRAALPPEPAAAFALSVHDFVRVAGPAQEESTLYLVDGGGNQAFAVKLGSLDDGSLRLSAEPRFLPMNRFGGMGLVVAGDALAYDSRGRWLPLVEQRRPLYDAEALLTLAPLDGRDPDCVWHRLLLDGFIPPGAGLVVASRAANDPETLPLLPWQVEPAWSLRAEGPDAPDAPFLARRSDRREETRELLFQRAVGRFLELRLTFTSNSRATARIGALRATYPRFSYLREYLPAVYRDDPTSASFLDRFLALFEGFFTSIEDRIAAVRLLFDPVTTPDEALDWLGSWLGEELDAADLDPRAEARRRLFLDHALTLFQWRGTPRGLRMALRLALDETPTARIFAEPLGARPSPRIVRILEHFRQPREPHRFTVSLPLPRGRALDPAVEQQRLALARRVLAREAPAHTAFTLRFHATLFRLGESRLGLETEIEQGSRWSQPWPPFTLDESSLAHAHVAAGPPFAPQDRPVLGRDRLGSGPPSGPGREQP